MFSFWEMRDLFSLFSKKMNETAYQALENFGNSVLLNCVDVL